MNVILPSLGALSLLLQVDAGRVEASQVEARSPRAGASSALDAVGELQAALAASLDMDVSVRERSERIEPVLRASFDLEARAKELLGAAWAELPRSESEAVLGSLARLVSACVAARVDGMRPAEFTPAELRAEKNGEEALDEVEEGAGRGGGAVLVATRLVPEKGKPLELELRLLEVDGTWRVLALSTDGVPCIASDDESLLAVASQAGADALAFELERRAERYEETPSELVGRLQSGLIETMKAGERLGYQGRYARLSSLISDTHDVESVAKLTVKRYWDDWSDAQRQRFAAAFSRLSVATYAARFDGWANEAFEVSSQEDVGRAGVLVKSKLVKGDGDEIRFDYLFHRRDGQWRVLNIVVDGVSDLALKKAEYTTVLDKEGFGALVAKLEEQIARYEAGEKDA